MQKLKIGRHTVQVTHEDKILFPKSKITKGDLINYYLNVAKFMIPHMKDRPVMMHRFVEGIDDPKNPGFFQKNISEYFPAWIKRIKIEKKEGDPIEQLLCNNAETLVYIANQLCITPHIWLSRAYKIATGKTDKVNKINKDKKNKINYPDKLIFDLDPAGFTNSGKNKKNSSGNKKTSDAKKTERDFSLLVLGAKKVKKLLESLGLTPFVMTTGSKGMHIVVPIKRENNFDFVKEFAIDCATILEKQNPEIFTNQMRKEKRENKIFLDIYRNAYAQTSVAPYAVRAIEGAPIATPIDWREVNKNFDPQKYNIKNIFIRLEKKGDIWENFEKYACSLREARRKLNKIYNK